MKKISGVIRLSHLVLALSLLAPQLTLAAVAPARPMGDYCVVPPFIKKNIPPNLLLMIDNSSSMYDLTYADEGNKDPSTGTITRQPYYCFDETYKARACSNNSLLSCAADTDCGAGTCIVNLYGGYFDSATYYAYDTTNKYFTVVGSLPGSCSLSVGNELCVSIDATGDISAFAASGNYLNWLTSSKFDVEKKILTGGKYVDKICKNVGTGTGSFGGCTSNSDCNVSAGETCVAAGTSFLVAETRGCLGQKFVKDILSTDFVNFTGATDPNTANKLGLTFGVRGPLDSANPSAPSRGGQTFLEIYSGTYNNKLCQDAMTVWGSATANQNTVKTAVETCLNYDAKGTSSVCQNNNTIKCSSDANCIVTTQASAGKCSNNATISCSADTDCGSTTVTGTCSNNALLSCTANADCGTTTNPGTCSNNNTQSCTDDSTCNFPAVIGKCSNNAGLTCSADADCTYATVNGNCSGSGAICTADAGCANIKVHGKCTNNAALCLVDTDCTVAAVAGKCSNNAGLNCSVDGDCTYATTAGKCSNNTAMLCTGDAGCGTTAVAGKCSNDATKSCTADSDCPKPAVAGKCSLDATISCNADSDCTYTTPGKCSNDATIACTSNAICGSTWVKGKCSKGAKGPCDSNADCTFNTQDACTNPAAGWVANTCTNPSPVPVNKGTCTAPKPVAASPGDCTNPKPSTVQNTCNNPSPVISTGTCTNPKPVAAGGGTCTAPPPSIVGQRCDSPPPILSSGTCTNPAPAAASVGVCTGITTTQNNCLGYSVTPNTCVGNVPYSSVDYSPCVNLSQSARVKTKITYSHTIQTCWTYWKNGKFSNGDSQRLTNSCDDVYTGWGICSLDNTVNCSSTVPCAAANGTCVTGPDAIRPGNPALICGREYMGIFCTWSSAANKCTWNLNATDPTPDEMFARFCDSQQPTVIDPTDSAASSSNLETVPAILSGVGVEAQLGAPKITMPVKIVTAAAPTGLLQEFNGRVRVGAMSFNFNGAKTESGTAITSPRVCSNDHTRLCTLDVDCGTGNTCLSTSSTSSYIFDGGKIVTGSYVGEGKCAVLNSTVCTVDADCAGLTCLGGFCGTSGATRCATDSSCGSGETCVANGVGDHTTGLVSVLDGIRANAWTPFAEAFYEAIGYFARTAAGNSRDLRLDASDYVLDLNPSQYTCQLNYTLLITDGASTADQNTSVQTLAQTYATDAGVAAATCPSYAGSTYLPIMTWIAKNRNIADFTKTPTVGRDYFKTYVVTTGGDNGQTGECNSLTLMADTATKGGSTLRQANNPDKLAAELREIFNEVVAQTSSGTAASILSNSEGSGANILQAVFYPRKSFDNATTNANWLGEMQNLWYYVDPFLSNSTVREDSDFTAADLAANNPHRLNLTKDYVAKFAFNSATNQTEVKLKKDTDGDGLGDANPPLETPDRFSTKTPDVIVSADDVKSVWRAGRLLWSRPLATLPRKILTRSGSTLFDLNSFPTGVEADDVKIRAYLLQKASTDATNTVALNPDARNIIDYVVGVSDHTTDLGWRSRKLAIKGTENIWKLGDIISSTPRVQSTIKINGYNMPPSGGYNDTSYGDDTRNKGFIYTDGYTRRGMAYVGANDGMLHAFKLGKLDVTATGDLKATLSGTRLGEEQWGFIPRGAMPYLQYLSDPNYPHIYYVDGATTIVDVSTGCATSPYWECVKDFPDVPTSNFGGGNWRTLLIGGMGIGGASQSADYPGANTKIVKTPVGGTGLSEYFALDITNQYFLDDTNPAKVNAAGLKAWPSLLWEFNGYNSITKVSDLGYATSGPAIVKINALTAGKPDITKNGRWLAVFASGPTGPIDTATCSFQGGSEQHLKIFIVDLMTGYGPSVGNAWVIDTGITNAFAGAITNGVVDADRWNKDSDGYYADDAIYIPYTQLLADGTWSGGVGRLSIPDVIDPGTMNPATDWTWNIVVDGVGPVTTNVAKLQDRKNHKLWLYFGTGRYFYNQDDMSSRRTLYGIKDPCYKESFTVGTAPNVKTIKDDLDPACTGNAAQSLVDAALLTDQSGSTPAEALSVTADKGWKIDLDIEDTTKKLGAERSITDAVAMVNGAVFFTTFKPTGDPCQFGGQSFLWAAKYDTGGTAQQSALQGKILVQVSTGSFEEKDLSTAFNDTATGNRRISEPMTGKPPTDPPPVVSKGTLKPVKKILHIQEH